MSHVHTWLALVYETLEEGEEACLDVIRAFPRSRRGAGTVDLVEGETTTLDALAYATVLRELGRDVEAEEVLRAVIGAELGLDPRFLGRQGAQVQPARPQGDQPVAIEA